ncbi:MAG: hypothetical protein JNN25_03650 [Candidatus Kapabacteria bacterium]|nr:hypothetical protein [Candidatus Kapabacteria bacterium]
MNRIFASTALALFLLVSTPVLASSGQTSRLLALPDVHFLQSTTDKPSTKGSFSLALPDVHFLQSTTDKPTTKGSFSLALPDVHFLQSTTDKPSTKGSLSLALPDVHFLQSTTDKPSTKGSFSVSTSSVQFSQTSVLPLANNYTTVSKYGKKSILLSIFDKGVITEQQYADHIARRNALLIKRS